jgi:hypothetical protein
MNMDTALDPRTAVTALRRFAKPRPAVERCELCSAPLGAEHAHLVEPEKRRLLCACEACAILFSGAANTKFRRASRRVRFLPDFRLSDADWDGLAIPISLAFFVAAPNGAAAAVYPSPAGPTESRLDLAAWADVVAANPELRDLEPDTEALLVNRVGRVREHIIVPIDECYRLVGLIRKHWRGLSGGDEVWAEIGQLFARLKERSRA